MLSSAGKSTSADRVPDPPAFFSYIARLAWAEMVKKCWTHKEQDKILRHQAHVELHGSLAQWLTVPELFKLV